MDKNQSRSSGQAVFAIDGGRIRALRESRQLTQLYVATVLGITVDTVSRWENGRSPNIKLENAEKLAEVLDVSLDDIARQEPPQQEDDLKESGGESLSRHHASSTLMRKVGPYLAVALVILAGMVVFAFYHKSRPVPPALTAHRFLPRHVSARQSFPVVIAVQGGAARPFSFLVKENIPSGCELLAAVPAFYARNRDNGQLKWLGQSGQGGEQFFAYRVMVGDGSQGADPLRFSGTITSKGDDGAARQISGDLSVPITDAHWADANGDGIIDDDEILTIYNSFDLLQELGVNIDEIQQIWASKGYRWDEEKKKYVGIH